MCWNKDISLNTFIVSISILGFIYYNNKYTQYKIESFQRNIFIYLFFISFISIQLVEYFLWKNLDNPKANQIISTIGLIIIFLEPLFAILGFATGTTKRILLIGYIIFVITYFLYRIFISKSKPFTKLSPTGHLSWDWFKIKGWESIFIYIWIIFFLWGLGGDGDWTRTLIAGVLLLWSVFLFKDNKTWGSLWCWVANIIMLYYLLELLIIKPYKEHGFCGV